MRQLNIWVLGSVGLAFVAGGFIGWIVTRVGCPEGSSCVGSSILIGLTAGFVAAVGVGIVVVLATRSMEEWRSAQAAGGPMPEPGCETDEQEAR